MARPRPTAAWRYWSRVRFDGPLTLHRQAPGRCWTWTGAINNRGYGSFRSGPLVVGAHRWSYVQLRGEIPAGLELDHRCRNRACVNPAHTEPVTHRVNTLRSTGPTARAARATACPSGHPYDAANTVRDKRGARRCLACSRHRALSRTRAVPFNSTTEIQQEAA
ncbi:HNH endonuclease signature motif containing protein [Streptomyces sp. NPDC058195]|uniref:HNH endonuclease signature motif containing protein n=1 Tax=Streptomyces sp. NPDC058195 TaxID=3346375 RepID=UPI0036EC0AEB